jgi:hypothetical protein
MTDRASDHRAPLGDHSGGQLKKFLVPADERPVPLQNSLNGA